LAYQISFIALTKIDPAIIVESTLNQAMSTPPNQRQSVKKKGGSDTGRKR